MLADLHHQIVVNSYAPEDFPNDGKSQNEQNCVYLALEFSLLIWYNNDESV